MGNKNLNMKVYTRLKHNKMQSAGPSLKKGSFSQYDKLQAAKAALTNQSLTKNINNKYLEYFIYLPICYYLARWG